MKNKLLENVFSVIKRAALFAALTILFLPMGACERKSAYDNNVQQYKTDYVGDSTKVIRIVENQEYPGYLVDHVEIQSEREPYGLKVYLNVDETETSKSSDNFQTNADLTFDSIGNLGIIDYIKVDSNEILASYERAVQK